MDLDEVTNRHNVYLHSYADDSQMYVHCERRNTASTIARLGHCVDGICHWMAANRLQMNPAKTELLLAGSKHNISLLGSHALVLHLRSDTVTASDHVRVLGVTCSSDLSLEKHVSEMCSASFHWLRQLHRVRKSLDDGSAATLVHAFVTSRVDYCNALYAGALKMVTDKLQRVLNAAARVASDTRKFDRGLTTLLHGEVHWLDVPERVIYKLGVMMYCCLHGLAPRYLADHLTPASDVASRLRLRSANHQLIVPRC